MPRAPKKRRLSIKAPLRVLGFAMGVFLLYSHPSSAADCVDFLKKNPLLPQLLSEEGPSLEGFLKFKVSAKADLDRGIGYLLDLYLGHFSDPKLIPLKELIKKLDSEDPNYHPFFRLLSLEFLSRLNLSHLSLEEGREVFQYTLSEGDPKELTTLYQTELNSLITTLDGLSGAQKILELKSFLNGKGLHLSDLSEFKKLISPLSNEDITLLALWLSHSYSLKHFEDFSLSSSLALAVKEDDVSEVSAPLIHFRDEKNRILVPKREALRLTFLEKAKSGTDIEREFFRRYSQELILLLEGGSISLDELFGEFNTGGQKSKIVIAHSHKTGENFFLILPTRNQHTLYFVAPRNEPLIRKQRWRRLKKLSWLTFWDLKYYNGRFLKPALTETSLFGRVTSNENHYPGNVDVLSMDFIGMYGTQFDLSDGRLLTISTPSGYRSPDQLYFEVKENPSPETRALVPIENRNSTSTSR